MESRLVPSVSFFLAVRAHRLEERADSGTRGGKVIKLPGDIKTGISRMEGQADPGSPGPHGPNHCRF